MNTIPSHIFCSKHSDCEAPISVITEILSENDPIKFENISNEFKALGFTKVKDLAQITVEKASSIKLSGNSSTMLHKALEMYDKHLDDLQTSAKLEYQNGNFIRTQQICEELLQQIPNDLNVICLMGQSYHKSENNEKSIGFPSTLMNLNPNTLKTFISNGFNYYKQSKDDLAKQDVHEGSLKLYSNFDFWITYTDALVKLNDIEMAEYIYVQILIVHPDSCTIRNKYGKFLLSQNKIKNAKQQFKIAQKSAPEFQETLINLGDVYFSTKKYDKAILNYCKALEVNPNLKLTLFNLGKIYFKITEYQKAIDALKKVIELDPENYSALKYLAVTYKDHGNMLMSVETLKKCLKLVSDDLNINLELAMIYIHNLNDFQEAEVYLKKCIELAPQRDDLYMTLYTVYHRLKKKKDAADICLILGDVYANKGDLINAKNVFYNAVCENPNNAYCHWKLGLILHRLGYYSLAKKRYKHANNLMPDFAGP